MRLLALLASVLPLGVFAAGSPSAINATSLIPDDISDSCYTLLTRLNEDSVFQKCTEPLIEATDIYANLSSSNTSRDSLSKSLDSLCNHDYGCDRAVVRQYIAYFWDQCSDELESQNDQVMQLYDYMYIFNPFRDAICSKDSKNNYCLQTLAPFMQPSADLQMLQLNAMVPDAGDVYSDAYWSHVMATMPSSNSSSSSSEALAPEQVFLFLSGSTDKDTLCSECTRHVLAAYIGFEMGTPYALGTERSTVLKPQQTIYDNARKQCGADFVHNINQQAGVQQFADASGAAALRVSAWAFVVVVGAALALL